jgi:hypothetical protein
MMPRGKSNTNAYWFCGRSQCFSYVSILQEDLAFHIWHHESVDVVASRACANALFHMLDGTGSSSRLDDFG